MATLDELIQKQTETIGTIQSRLDRSPNTEAYGSNLLKAIEGLNTLVRLKMTIKSSDGPPAL